ncbi:MAG: pentapeptide repeat-containing protein [Methyloligellaceae bacterium]
MSETTVTRTTVPLVTSDELLEAANDASAQARNMWLFFLGLLTYLIVTIAGTTHQNLLLNNPVRLPFLNVDIPLTSFFVYAPAIVVTVHLGLLIQHAMLAFKLFRFTETLDDEGWHRQGTDPRRGKLHPYIISQLIAGPERGAMMGFLIRFMTWFSLVAMPVMTLLYFQIAFLPYHDVAATYWHRIAVLLDCLILFALWPYMRPATAREAKAKMRSGQGIGWPWRVTFLGSGAGGLAMLALLMFSWFVATVPDACLYKSQDGKYNILCLDRMMTRAMPWRAEIKSGNTQRKMFGLTAWLFEGAPNPVTGRPTSWWSRNIVLTDVDLVPEKEFGRGEVSLSLRGRDLRYAVLDRTDLHRADFTGVDLTGASLRETRLEDAKFCHALKTHPRKCSDFEGANLTEANLKGVDFESANLQGAQLALVKLEGAIFRNAELEGANLTSADLKGADLSLANLKGAKLSYAKLQGANFGEAELQEADLLEADLQGARFADAQLEGANLAAANLRAAELSSARLNGADLSKAKLEGADLRQADLRGTNLSSASMKGTDLRFVRLWGALHPGKKTNLELANLTGASFESLTDDDREELKDVVESIENKDLQKRLMDKLKKSGLMESSASNNWKGQADWETSVGESSNLDPEIHTKQFNKFWSDLACRYPEIVVSVVRRIGLEGYFQDRADLAKQLTLRTCESAHKASAEDRAELCRIANWSLSMREDTVCG